MVTATFIFQQHTHDADFHVLNDRIRDVAEMSDGYLGQKSWTNDEGQEAVVYYWRSMGDLTRFQKDATHKLAKSRYKEWYAGYRIEIADVTMVRGDDLFSDWPR